MGNILAQYRNGNYTVQLFDDGTKIKTTDDDTFCASFPDSIDLKITNRCDRNCPMCHEQSTPDGAHGSIDEAFLSRLHPGTEVAIGGGNPLAHPALLQLLKNLKAQGVIANITVNEAHLLAQMPTVQNLIDDKLVYGVGVSMQRYDDATVRFMQQTPNAVAHIIAGIVLPCNMAFLADKNLKILILGYKQYGRGKEFFSPAVQLRIRELKNLLPHIKAAFAAVGFDNLALEQLDVRQMLGENSFDEHFFGNDGTGSMYVDLVKRQFAVSSTAAERFALLDTMDAMFKAIQVQ